MCEGGGARLFDDIDADTAHHNSLALLETITGGAYRLDEDNHVVAVTDPLLELTGYSRPDVLGEHVSVLLDDGASSFEQTIDDHRSADDTDTDADDGADADATDAGDVVTIASSVRTAEDGTIPCELRATLLDTGDEFQGTVGIVRPHGGTEDATRTGEARTADHRTTSDRNIAPDFPQILGRVSDGFYALDEDFRFTYVNATAEDLLGYDAADLHGAHVWDVFPEAVGSNLHEQYETVVETQEPSSFERYSEPLGIWAEVNVYPSETGLSVYFHNVTNRKKLEQELRRTERRFEAIFDDPNILVGLLEPDGTVVDINETAMEYIEPDLDDVTGEPFWETPWWGESHDVQPDVKRWTERAAAGEYVDFEADLTRPDGQRYTLSGYFRPVTNEDGEVVSIIVSDRDVSERKERERQLEESEQRYRTLAEYFPNGLVTLFDHNLEYTLAAGQGFDRIPVDPSDLEGRTFDEVWPEETADALEPAFQAALSGEEQSVELEYAGQEWVLHAAPITDERGDVFAGMTMAQDITEQKARERYLEDAKAQLEAATEAGAVGTWEWRIPEDRFVTGASFAKTFGVDPEAAREGVPLDWLLEAIHEDDRDRVAAKIEEAVETCGEYEAEYRVWDAGGELRWVVARGHVECDEDGTAETFPGALTDITERKRAELERQRRQLETLFRVLPVGVVVADDDGSLRRANETAREIWGDDVFDATSVADYEKYPATWADSGASVDPEEWTMAQVLRGEEVTEPNVYEIDAFDGERRIIMEHGMPVRDEDGDVSRAVVTLTDITERREFQRKLETTVEQLESSNERLEQFAYAASHDLQEPLRMVISYLQLLERRYGDAFDEDGQEFLDFAVDGADRMREMIDGLLEYSRVETRGDPFQPVELHAVFDDVRENLQLRIDEQDAEIAVEDLPRVHGDASQLRQVLQNLLSNALTYSGDEPPRVHVSADRRGDEWVISVADDGIGIDPDNQDRIFTVFDRLHSRKQYEGTGIGLALCQRIVERHGGDIWVESEPGEGSTFSFTVPAVPE